MPWTDERLSLDSDMVLETFRRGSIRELRLRGGRGNALGPALLAALADALAAARRDAAPPLLLCAEGGSFCTGLDLRHALSCSRPQLIELMRSFHLVLAELLLYPAPTLAAIGGHALAGGALLALACDRRLIAEGAGRIGIHGAKLGIGYPDIALELVRLRFARPQAEHILYAGELHAAEAAPAHGFADRLLPADELHAAALQSLEAAGGPAYAANKARLLAPLRARLLPPDEAGLERFAEHWFGGDTQRRLREVVARLSGDAEGSAR